MKTILKAISESQDSAEIDAMFAILKYKGLGIMRKLKSFALVLDLEEEIVLKEAPKDESGRILDRECRHLICDGLIKISQTISKIQKQ